MKKLISVIGILVISSVCNLSLAGDTSKGKADLKNVNDFLCKDILRTSGEDRNIAVAFMHGYLLGKSGKSTFNKAELSEATDHFIEACLDNTKGGALDTLGKQIK